MILHLLKTHRALGALLFLGFLLPSVSFAQNAVSFTVSPTIFDMTANPGQVWNSTIRVINANPYDLMVYMDVVNFKPQGESGVPVFSPSSAEDRIQANFAAWISTTPELTLPAETTIELPIQISVPADAEPGGHFAAVLIGTKPPEKTDNETKVETSQVISSLLFLRVSGDIREEATVRSFRSLDYFLNRPETTFELRIENTGNVHVQPQGDIKIYNMWGQERGVIPVNKQSLFGNVLSDSVRKYNFEWKGEWSLADIGRYTVEATLTYGTNARQSLTADASFWVVPWKILLVTIVSLVGFVYLFTWGVKLYIRKMLLMAGVPAHEMGGRRFAQRKKQVSVTAPLGAGMLDLRTRLERTSSLAGSVTALIAFIKSYWKFFLVALFFIIFIVLIVQYLLSALTPNRYYEVTTDAGVTVTSDELEADTATPSQTAPENTPEESAVLGDPVITVVNRSGFPELTATVIGRLSNLGYEISSSYDESGSSEEKTVIVFSASQTETALALSAALDSALLSSLSAEKPGMTPEITIYIGSDALNY